MILILTKQKELIEAKRIELIECVKNHGVSSIKTLQLSQELDVLINNFLVLGNKTYLVRKK